ncbi:ubiquinol-cytochrome c reductase complex assembly factor 6 [Lampetra fluviatilis]
MPAGVTWPRYLKMLTASLLSMLAGAEVVHRYYRPDLSIPEVPPAPGQLQTRLLGIEGTTGTPPGGTRAAEEQRSHPS